MIGPVMIVLSVLMVGVFLLTMLLVKKGADRTVAARDKALEQNAANAPQAVGEEQKNAVRWIFFDMGSTLLDEEEAYRHRVRDMVRGTSVRFEEFWEKRIRFAREGFNGDAKAAEHFGLAKTRWPGEDERPFPDAAPTLQALSDKGYRLGVIANQEPGAAARLAAWDLARFFSVVAASAELGVAKPDKAIFRWALKAADCAPQNAVMVGDRLDNDVRPAKELGMRTVRIRKGLAVYMQPTCEAEVPDHTIDELHELLGIF